MTDEDRDGTQELPESSRDALIWAADQLRHGFSGEIILRCHDGGVREVRENRVHQPGDLRQD